MLTPTPRHGDASPEMKRVTSVKAVLGFSTHKVGCGPAMPPSLGKPHLQQHSSAHPVKITLQVPIPATVTDHL